MCQMYLATICGLLSTAALGAADVDPQIEADVVAARKAHIIQVELVQAEMMATLARAEDELRQRADVANLPKLEKIRATREALAERGELPSPLPPHLQAQMDKTGKALANAYRKAIETYIANKSGKYDARAKELAHELEQLGLKRGQPLKQAKNPPPAHIQGDWSSEDDQVTLVGWQDKRTFMEFGDPAWSDYIFSCELRVDKQPGAAGIRIRTDSKGNYWEFDCCAWGQKNTLDLAPVVVGERGKASGRRIIPNAMEFELSIWHKIEVTVQGNKVTVSIDGKERASSEHAKLLKGRVGLGGHSSVVASWRNIEVRKANGFLLWRGLPALPAGQSKGRRYR